MLPEPSFMLSDIDRAYLAGLFDGEGCANATFSSKKYFSKREQKEKIYFWPRVFFVISGRYDHMQQIKVMIGLGGVYEGSRGRVWDLRISQPRQIITIADAIFPYARLKQKDLKLLKNAAQFMSRRNFHSKWSDEEKDFFNRNFVLPLQKLTSTGAKPGARVKHKKTFVASPNKRN